MVGRDRLDRHRCTLEDLVPCPAALEAIGGPLVNAAGQVVGINSAAALTAENIGFAISVDVALPILTAIYRG